jgi:hypothetical protein
MVAGTRRPDVVTAGSSVVRLWMVTTREASFVSVTVLDADAPTATSPKSTAVGAAATVDDGSTAFATYVTVTAVVSTSVITEITPAAFPDVSGANRTARLVLAPGSSRRGSAAPDAAAPDPLAITSTIVTAESEGFASVTVADADDPTATSPNAMADGVAVRWDGVPAPHATRASKLPSESKVDHP